MGWKPLEYIGGEDTSGQLERGRSTLPVGDSSLLYFGGWALGGRSIEDGQRSLAEGLGYQNASLAWGSISGISGAC